MRAVAGSFARALRSQLRARMLLLTVAPFLLSVTLWGVVLWLTLQPMIDWLQRYFIENSGFRTAGSVLGWFGLGALKTVIVPLIAMWALVPLMILTALLFIGLFAMPAIARHVSARDYPELAQRHGGTLAGSVWVALSSFVVFVVLWILALPLSFIPVVGLLVHPLLWGWLTYRVMAYDALAAHAERDERIELIRRHRTSLLAIGTVTGLFGAVPTMLWLGGVMSVIFFPVLAAISIWLYVLVFTFSGLWFQHYCLAMLERMRAGSRDVRPN